MIYTFVSILCVHKYSTHLDKYKRVQQLDQATGVILSLVRISNTYFQSACTLFLITIPTSNRCQFLYLFL